MSRIASYREAVSFGALSSIALAVLTLASGVATARLFGNVVTGQFALVLTPIGVLWMLSTVQEQAALVRELATLEPRTPRVTALSFAVFSFSTALTILVAVAMSGAVVLLFNGPIDRPHLVTPTLVLLAAYVVLTNVAWNAISVLSAFRGARQLLSIRLAQAATFFALAIAASFVSDTVWGLVWATVAASVVELLVAVVAVLPYLTLRVTRGDLRDGFRRLPVMIRFGLKGAPGSVASGLSDDSGTWLLGLLSASDGAIGAWSRASIVSRRLIEVNYKVSEVLFPTMLERSAKGDRDGSERALFDSMRYLAGALLLAAAVAGGGAHSIMSIFGPNFTVAADALVVLSLLPVLYAAHSCFGQLLLVANRPFQTSIVSVLRLIVTVAVSVPLIQSLGLLGAALGMFAGYLVALLPLVLIARPHLSRPLHELWPLRNTAVLVVAYGCSFAAGRAVDSTTDGFAGLVLTVGAAGIAYVAAYWIAGGIRPEDRERARAVVRAVRARRQARALA